MLEDEKGTQYFEEKYKAEALATYCCTVFTPSSNSNLADDILRFTGGDVSTDMAVEPSKVLKILKALKLSMSIPYDGIPQILRILKMSSHAVHRA